MTNFVVSSLLVNPNRYSANTLTMPVDLVDGVLKTLEKGYQFVLNIFSAMRSSWSYIVYQHKSLIIEKVI